MTGFKRNQSGVILVITMFLLLIIAILTIAFLYLQFLEVDLIAHETDYLQAFYLASAGLEQGRKLLDDDPNIFNDPNKSPITVIDLASDKQGSFYHMYSSSESNGTTYVTIKGIGVVNNDKRTVKRTIIVSSTQGEPPPSHPFDPNFWEMREELEHKPGIPTDSFISGGELLWNPPTILSDYVPVSGYPRTEALTKEQHDAIDNYESKTKITKARNLNKKGYTDPYNDNREIWIRNKTIYDNYTRTSISELDTSNFRKVSPTNPYYWPYSEFDYAETRLQERYTSTYTGPSILQTEMVVHDDFVLEGSLKGKSYFLQKLKLEEGATLSTNGNVKIYTTQLEVGKDARLMGGSVDDPKPEKLIIVAEYWPGFPYNKDLHGIKLWPSARIYGHIFAPNMSVYLSRGKVYGPENETRVYGSVLAKEIALFVDPEDRTNIGYISIIGTGTANQGMADEPGSWREEVSTP
ncbi:MAG: hypothetical protein ACMUIM_04440 [bacterium]